jgi:choline dehydrogenase-like flavoprotein
MAVVVIGSGPAGAAAAHALCDAGVRVTVLDAGDRIEAGRMEPFDALARSEPAHWQPQLAGRVRSAFPADIKHVPLKPAYGSLFPYALNDPDLPVASENADAVASLAYGGLSNAWGASVLPSRQCDIHDWPISLDELRPHYEAVQRFMPVAAERDELREILPLYTDSPGALPRSRQAESLLAHLRQHAADLRAAGFAFGASRLAVTTVSENPDRHCRHCGLCLYGCPYHSIYNAAHTFDTLSLSGKIDYRGGVYVNRLTEVGDAVVIDFHQRGRPEAIGRLTASRVFVACGAIASPRLMFASMERPPRLRRMRDSQYFVIPVVARHAVPVSVATQGNTLAQVFIELDGGHISQQTVHLQVYGYNDIMLSALVRRVPRRTAALERVLRPVLGRLLIIQGFLHSADSPSLTIGYDTNGVSIVGDDMRSGSTRASGVVRRLVSHTRLLGMIPLPGLLHVGRPGKSNHLGGSLPMRREPCALETDMLGRIPSWKRVHIVDASVLPSVPATTVTLSVMANAHRIASAAASIGACDASPASASLTGQ